MTRIHGSWQARAEFGRCWYLHVLQRTTISQCICCVRELATGAPAATEPLPESHPAAQRHNIKTYTVPCWRPRSGSRPAGGGRGGPPRPPACRRRRRPPPRHAGPSAPSFPGRPPRPTGSDSAPDPAAAPACPSRGGTASPRPGRGSSSRGTTRLSTSAARTS